MIERKLISFKKEEVIEALQEYYNKREDENLEFSLQHITFDLRDNSIEIEVNE